jgi:hypothetical protein
MTSLLDQLEHVSEAEIDRRYPCDDYVSSPCLKGPAGVDPRRVGRRPGRVAAMSAALNIAATVLGL